MEKTQFEKYLKERYEDQVTWYDKKSISFQKKYKFWQSLIIFTSAVTPVLVAAEISKWPVIAISAIVAIGTTVIKTFKYQENWINYRTTCETLKKEIHFYQNSVGEYKTAEDPEALFIDNVESFISRENTLWLSAHRPKREN